MRRHFLSGHNSIRLTHRSRPFVQSRPWLPSALSSSSLADKRQWLHSVTFIPGSAVRRRGGSSAEPQLPAAPSHQPSGHHLLLPCCASVSYSPCCFHTFSLHGRPSFPSFHYPYAPMSTSTPTAPPPPYPPPSFSPFHSSRIAPPSSMCTPPHSQHLSSQWLLWASTPGMGGIAEGKVIQLE